MDVRGVFISMGGYTTEVPDSLSGTRENNVVLLDGVHLFNVFYDAYVFQELMEHALNYALSKGEIYCPTNITH